MTTALLRSLSLTLCVLGSTSLQLQSQLPRLLTRPVDCRLNPASKRGFVIADGYGREVVLRGIAVETEARAPPPYQVPLSTLAYANGSCPSNRAEYSNPPVCQVDAGRGKYSADIASPNDLAQIRALGFNLVRLCLSWDRLEPTPGTYSGAYLERVAQMVEWAREQDVYVVLDLHEDLFSQYVRPSHGLLGIPPILQPAFGADGAPAWAVQAGGFPSVSPFGIDQANPAMLQAFEALWRNKVLPGIPQGDAPGRGLQDHFIGAIAALARRFADEPAVMGIELINEPQSGWTNLLRPYSFAETLYGFYRRTVQAITGVRDGLPTCDPGTIDTAVVGTVCAYPDLAIGWKGIILTEPHAIRNLIDRSLQDSKVWTSYPYLVHAPHVYTHTFTLDQTAPGLAKLILPSPWPPSFEYAYDTAWQEANAMNSAVLVTEFGTSPRLDMALVKPTIDAQEATLTPAVLWAWKTNCQGFGPTTCAMEGWSVYSPAQGPVGSKLPPNGPLYPTRQALLSRTHARAVLGELLSNEYNSTTKAYTLTANASAEQVQAAADRSQEALADWDSLLARSGLPLDAAGCPSGWGPQVGAGTSHTPMLCATMRTAQAVLEQSWAVTDPSAYRPALPFLLGLHGSSAELYIPSVVPSWPVMVIGGAQLRQVVAWPDGSRTAYINVIQQGSYTILMEGENEGKSAL